MSLSRIPLPSIAHVLTSDRASLPAPPSIIKFEFDPLQTIYPTSTGHDHLLDPLGTQNDSIGIQADKVPVVDESFFFCLANDSSTVGHSDHGQQLNDGSDPQTVEKRPTASHGLGKSKALNNNVMLKRNVVAFASTIRALLQFKIKGINDVIQVPKAVVDV